jgi:hypothetical protein
MDLTIDLQDFSRKNVYEMVETTAYFEAYNPILEGLQQTKDEDLPFQVGIIIENIKLEGIIKLSKVKEAPDVYACKHRCTLISSDSHRELFGKKTIYFIPNLP